MFSFLSQGLEEAFPIIISSVIFTAIMRNHSSAILNHEGSLENEGKRQASLEKLLKKS